MTEKVKTPEKVSHKAALRALELEKAQIELASLKLDLDADNLRHEVNLRSNAWDGTRGMYHGVFRLDGGITADGVAGLSLAIHQWMRLPGNEQSPLTLHICSGGGDAFASLGLYDTLRTISSQGRHVTTVVRGFAGSGAGVVSQAGDLRLIGAESFLHIHEAGSGIRGKAAEVKDEAQALEQMSRKMAEIYARRAKGITSEDIYRKFERREWWLSSDEVLEYGFADQIG